MGLFSRNKSEGSTKKNINWNPLTSVEQLNEVVQSVTDKPVLLFKHSTRCGISSMALNTFEREWSSDNELANIYMLDLLRHRDISSEIAEITGIMHQSPQVVVLKGTEVIYEASHSSIDARKIESLLK
jgi:bacillithiol system protein YtxJ